MRTPLRIGLALLTLLAVSGSADAHALGDLIQCIQEGPYCS